ncbi:MAG: AAA family ATPase [Pyrobaculum sp.]
MERELQPALERGLVFAVVRPRRAGKTFYLYQLGRPLDVRLVGLRPSHFSSFLRVAAEYRGALLLLNEVLHWGRWVRSLLDRGHVVAGSSSQLLQSEVATELRGRCLSKVLLPLSFREFLRARGLRPTYLNAPEARGELLGALGEYLNTAYPEAVLKPHLAQDLLKM